MHTGGMDLAYLGIGLVLIVGISVVAYGWLSDRSRYQRRKAQLQAPPQRAVPGLSDAAPAPRYRPTSELLTPGEQPTVAPVTDEQLGLLHDGLAEAVSLPFGYAAAEFANLDSNRLSPVPLPLKPDIRLCALFDPVVFVSAEPITTVRELLPLLKRVHENPRPLLIVAPTVNEEVLETLRVNAAQGRLQLGVSLLPDETGRQEVAALSQTVPARMADLRSGYLPDSNLGSARFWVGTADHSWLRAGPDISTSTRDGFSRSNPDSDPPQA